MKTLKFRCWDTVINKFTIINDFLLSTGGFLVKYDEDGTKEYIEENKFIITQYTGSNDKDHNEIYEGDILQYTEIKDARPILVVFKKGYFGLSVCHTFNPIYLWKEDLNYYRIIGNIFETPELLPCMHLTL